MLSKNRITLFIFCFYLFLSFEAFSQRQLKIVTNLDNSFERYIVTIYDTNYVSLAKYTFYTPDTTITYAFTDSNFINPLQVMLSGGSGLNIYFHVSKRVILRTDSLCTIYDLKQISKAEIKYYKDRMDHPSRTIRKRESGIFNKESPWMYAIGYTYQNDQLINLEVRKTGVDISGSHNDGLYAMTLFYAPYIILGGDATIYPNLQFAPKVGIGCYALLVNANISYIGYNTNFNKFNPAIVPEVGFSFPFGFLHIDYGYNLYLNNIESFNKNNQRVSIKFSWYFNPKKVW